MPNDHKHDLQRGIDFLNEVCEARNKNHEYWIVFKEVIELKKLIERSIPQIMSIWKHEIRIGYPFFMMDSSIETVENLLRTKLTLMINEISINDEPLELWEKLQIPLKTVEYLDYTGYMEKKGLL